MDGRASFTCVCKAGWKGPRCQDGESRFLCPSQGNDDLTLVAVCCFDRTDIDECSDPEFPAGCNQKCTNVPGSFHCMCEEGYFLTDKTNCVGKSLVFVRSSLNVEFDWRRAGDAAAAQTHLHNTDRLSSCCPQGLRQMLRPEMTPKEAME